MSIVVHDELDLPLRTMGTKIYFESYKPSDKELRECVHIKMNSPNEWNPHEVVLGEVSTDDTEPFSIHIGKVQRYVYQDPTEDDALLHSTGCWLHSREIQQVDGFGNDIPDIRPTVSHDRHQAATEKSLCEKFGIGLKQAKATLRVTTQKGIRSAIMPLSRRYKTDRFYDTKRLVGKFATDTVYYPRRTIHQNIGTQLYTHKCGFRACYHMDKVDGNKVGNTLADFVHEFGAPQHLTFDGASVQVGRKTKFQQVLRRSRIDYHVSQPYRPNENPAEQSIREVKKRWYRIQAKSGAHSRLADYGVAYVCETGNICANSSKYSNGRTPLEIITGETPDISEYLDFDFYDWVTFKSNAGVAAPELGRWLGVSHRVGPMMSYWILPVSGIPISCTSVQRLTNLEKQLDTYKRRMQAYDDTIQKKYDAPSSKIKLDPDALQRGKMLDLQYEDEEFLNEYNRVIDDPKLPHEEEMQIARQEILGSDPYLNMRIGLSDYDDTGYRDGVVKHRAIDDNGRPLGIPSTNPALDTRKYHVEFADGTSEIISANVIAENVMANVDEEGHRQMLIDSIIDHRTTSDAIPKSQGTYTTLNGLKRKKRTTRGWEFCIKWKGGSSDWVSLKDLKDSYPVQLAEYCQMKKIDDEPAMAWWTPHVLKKRDRIIKKVKGKFWERTHKYGIRVPRNIKEAKEIDDENGNTQWQDAIAKEMTQIKTALTEYEGDTKDLIGFQGITGHMIFDIKLGENFRRKARYCADGHKTETPKAVTYSSVVSRDSVRILLLIAALNDFNVLSADVQNAFLTAPNKEKIYLKAGIEFGDDQGKVYIVDKALYGLKSASASFRAYVADTLDTLGYKSSPADPDVWLRPAIKTDGEKCYDYVMTYVDDLVAIGINPETTMEGLGETFKFKNNKVEKPDTYLGAKLKWYNQGFSCWTISSVDYVNAAVKTIEAGLKGKAYKLVSKPKTPMTSNYHPEMDGTPELDAEDRRYYQELIGILRWSTEIGRVDILHEVSIMSQYQALPREGHLQEVLRIIAYLKSRPKLTIFMDPRIPPLDLGMFPDRTEEFKEYYRDAEELMPYDAPVPRGRPVMITAYVDASHASNRITRRSHSGFIVFVNRAPILWYSKRQQTVETSAFSAEMIALKVCIEAIQGLRYKLRMFGVPLPKGEPSYVLCDNSGCVNNASKVESVLNKKHSSVAYNYCRWATAAGVIRVAWVPTDYNLADALTKRLPEVKRDKLFGDWTY